MTTSARGIPCLSIGLAAAFFGAGWSPQALAATAQDQLAAAAYRQTDFHLKNASRQNITLYYVGRGGAEREFQVIGPGETASQQSYAGNKWRIRSAEDGRLLFEFSAASDGVPVEYRIDAAGQVTLSRTLRKAVAYDANYLASDQVYDRLPDVESCDPGELKASEKKAVLDELNIVRTLHRLPPLAYDPASDGETAHASLVNALLSDMTHTPSSGAPCYSRAAYAGASTSNLNSISLPLGNRKIPPSVHSVAAWMVDHKVASLGHRRTILNPFLAKTSYGRVDGPSLDGKSRPSVQAMKVIYADKPAGLALPDFVAYPFGDYPGRFFRHGWRMSFSAIASQSDFWANNRVSYADARIEVLDSQGRKLNVHSINAHRDSFGLPNLISWQVDDTQDGESYSVSLDNVQVNGTARNFRYQFRIAD